MIAADILVFGAGAVGVGVLVMGAVLFELKQRAVNAPKMMAVGLGMGIFAFGAKLALIVGYGLYGDRYLAATLPHNLKAEEVMTKHLATTLTEATLAEQEGHMWSALPRVAPAPHDNPTTPEKVELGKRLFNDPRLSADGTVACASCHDIKAGGGDGLAVSKGIMGQHGNRNAPTVLNAAYQSVLFWDGRAASLEEQAKGPLINPVEMGMPNHDSVVERVKNDAGYRQEFANIFGGEDPVNIDNIARAIASFERTLITPDAPYDRFVRGDATALTSQQQRGMALFAEFGCVMCHSGPNFSDASMLSNAMPYRAFPAVRGTEYEARYRLTDDIGMAANSEQEGGGGVWRVPSLRNVTRTAPYFHNGSVKDIKEAVRIMARVQLDKPNSNQTADDWKISWSPQTHTTDVRPNAVISDSEIEDIVAFLHSLEGDVVTQDSSMLAASH